MKRKPLLEGLRGPQSHDAERMVRLALSLTDTQARVISDMWKLDTHPDYMSYCSIVAKALQTAGRSLPMGWFEACFCQVTWLEDTKALHAVADAVMATLAKDLVAAPITQALVGPWMQMIGSREDMHPFLLNETVSR